MGSSEDVRHLVNFMVLEKARNSLREVTLELFTREENPKAEIVGDFFLSPSWQLSKRRFSHLATAWWL